ncbi:unnamed protein product [Paramecium sonneborni]|uniref:Uncharacterized protein n=1 Tax=Paramecium sonneborni TaxID=65129 RepID=A0A8S1LES1_9CILI|nr:unnamed protein product [Paramecium sonneborni]
MFILILLIVKAIQFTIKVDQTTCQCLDIPQEEVCNESLFCKWFEGSCQKLNCTDATDQDQCDRILPNSYKCAWNQGKCQKFTACSDYLVSQPQECFEKWFCVDGGVTANGLYTCADQNLEDEDENEEIICDNLISDEECIGIQKDGDYCVWNTTNLNCTSQSIKSCADASQTNQEYCKQTSCKWDEQTQECIDLSCDQFETEPECHFYFNFDFSEVTNCLWNNQKCIDFDITDLAPEQCLNITLNTYVWNSIQARCIECAESYILTLILIIILLMVQI